MKHELEKKSILMGDADSHEESPDYERAKQVPAKTQTVVVMNPMTRKQTELTIDAGPFTNEKLAMILTSPDHTREQKDNMIAQYLFQRGLESASFLAELFQSKGQHTKETRAFKSQMMGDFDSFIGVFCRFLLDAAGGIYKALGITEEDKELYYEKVKNGEKWNLIEPQNDALLGLAMRMEGEAKILRESMNTLYRAREREKGCGIYVDRGGKIYTLDDPGLAEVMEKDRREQESQDRA